MKRSILGGVAAVVLALSLITVTAADKKFDASKLPPAATQTGVTFDKDIKPIFEKSCTKCHSGDKPKSKLDLTALANVVKGGKNAPDVVSGKSAESPLVYAVAHAGDEDDFMPPPDNKAKIPPLTKEQVGLIRAWIDQGLK